MTTDTNQENGSCVNEPSKHSTSSPMSTSPPMSSASTITNSIVLPHSSIAESVIPTSGASPEPFQESHQIGSATSFNRSHTGTMLPPQSTSPPRCTSPQSVSPSSSSAFKIVPQRQKHLAGNIEGMII